MRIGKCQICFENVVFGTFIWGTLRMEGTEHAQSRPILPYFISQDPYLNSWQILQVADNPRHYVRLEIGFDKVSNRSFELGHRTFLRRQIPGDFPWCLLLIFYHVRLPSASWKHTQYVLIWTENVKIANICEKKSRLPLYVNPINQFRFK